MVYIVDILDSVYIVDSVDIVASVDNGNLLWLWHGVGDGLDLLQQLGRVVAGLLVHILAVNLAVAVT